MNVANCCKVSLALPSRVRARHSPRPTCCQPCSQATKHCLFERETERDEEVQLEAQAQTAAKSGWPCSRACPPFPTSHTLLTWLAGC